MEDADTRCILDEKQLAVFNTRNDADVPAGAADTVDNVSPQDASSSSTTSMLLASPVKSTALNKKRSIRSKITRCGYGGSLQDVRYFTDERTLVVDFCKVYA